jgi:hypothetical protein
MPQSICAHRSQASTLSVETDVPQRFTVNNPITISVSVPKGSFLHEHMGWFFGYWKCKLCTTEKNTVYHSINMCPKTKIIKEKAI